MKNVHLSINVSPLRTTAEVHHHDTTEDHEGCKNLLPTEGVHAETDTDGGGDDGLHVGIHADQGRTDALLPYRDKEIGDKSAPVATINIFLSSPFFILLIKCP